MNKLRFTTMEQAYVKQYVKANKRLLIVLMILLFLCMSDMFFPGMILSAIVEGVYSLDYSYKPHSYVNIAQLIACVGMLSFLLPLFQFRFLMKRSSSDLYLSLPIKRERLFYVQFVLGVGILVGTTSIISLLNIILYNFSYSDGRFGFSSGMGMALLLFIVIEVLGVCLYSFNTWLCLKCNTMLDAIIVMISYTIIPMLIHVMLYSFTSTIVTKTLFSTYNSYGGLMNSSSLSDLVWILLGFFSIPWLMRSTTQMFTGSYIGAMHSSSINLGYITSVIVWLVFGVMFFILAKKSFAKRKSEDSEFKTRGYLTYPILIPAITVCLLTFVGIYENTILWVVLVFVFYMGMQFFANRKIILTGKILLKYVSIVVIVVALEFTLIQTHVFGTVLEYPEQKEIQSVDIGVTITRPHGEDGWDSNRYTGYIKDQKGIQMILEEHQKLITHTIKERDYTKEMYSIDFHYELTSGKYMNRSYTICSEDIEIAEQLLREWLEEGFIENEADYLDYGVD